MRENTCKASIGCSIVTGAVGNGNSILPKIPQRLTNRDSRLCLKDES